MLPFMNLSYWELVNPTLGDWFNQAYYITMTINNTTVSWYSRTSAMTVPGEEQYNAEGYIYYYFAIA